jgi:hypothetical protein
MLFPKYVLEDLSVGSGSIIGKSNIEEFFNHISMHDDDEEKSLAELAPCYEVASAYLVHMLEARKVFKRFNKLGSPVEVVGTTNEDSIVPIPCKLVGIHDALEKNFSWMCPENLFDESSVPKRDYKGYSKTHLDRIHFFVEKTPTIDLNASFDIT